MEKKYSNDKNEDKNEEKNENNKNKITKFNNNTLKCYCSKPRFQREPKKECNDCIYKDILYLVP